MSDRINCFKAYDVRGTVPDELNPELCRAIGEALAKIYNPVQVVIGQDARLSSPELAKALTESLLRQGINVMALGPCGTEEIYHATATGKFDLGVMITGSHNPLNENGIKFVTRGAAPISSDSGLKLIASHAQEFLRKPCRAIRERGTYATGSLRQAYIAWLFAYTGFGIASTGDKAINPLRVLADGGNGCAGPVLAEISDRLPVDLILMNCEPDGNFPNGIPNPLLPKKRTATAAAVREHGADVGVAFDGDFDRCFFYDHTGRFIDSCYLAGLLAAEILHSHPGEKVVHDIRAYWNTERLVKKHGGIPIKGKAGHSWMKERMRIENAIFGAELSGHYFYRDFAYCDSGMLTMLLLLALLLRTGSRLSELVETGLQEYPCSGEVNFRVADAIATMESVWNRYRPGATAADTFDGINLEFPDWRFNLRASNTEPLLRLNIESRGKPELVQSKLAELRALIVDGQK